MFYKFLIPYPLGAGLSLRTLWMCGAFAVGAASYIITVRRLKCAEWRWVAEAIRREKRGRMNKIRVIIIALCSLASVAIADEEALVQERMVSIRAEGKQLDGLVIGAQARLDFIYVDAVLVEALRTPSGFPDWLRWHAKDFASEELKGGVLFVLRIETYNPWTFDPMKISVADYALKEEDILTKPAYVPKGDLPSHFEE